MHVSDPVSTILFLPVSLYVQIVEPITIKLKELPIAQINVSTVRTDIQRQIWVHELTERASTSTESKTETGTKKKQHTHLYYPTNVAFVDFLVCPAASNHHTDLDVITHIPCVIIVGGEIAASLEISGYSNGLPVT